MLVGALIKVLLSLRVHPRVTLAGRIARSPIAGLTQQAHGVHGVEGFNCFEVSWFSGWNFSETLVFV